jgi:hypothetical protein
MYSFGIKQFVVNFNIMDSMKKSKFSENDLTRCPRVNGIRLILNWRGRVEFIFFVLKKDRNGILTLTYRTDGKKLVHAFYKIQITVIVLISK